MITGQSHAGTGTVYQSPCHRVAQQHTTETQQFIRSRRPVSSHAAVRAAQLLPHTPTCGRAIRRIAPPKCSHQRPVAWRVCPPPCHPCLFLRENLRKTPAINPQLTAPVNLSIPRCHAPSAVRAVRAGSPPLGHSGQHRRLDHLLTTCAAIAFAGVSLARSMPPAPAQLLDVDLVRLLALKELSHVGVGDLGHVPAALHLPPLLLLLVAVVRLLAHRPPLQR